MSRTRLRERGEVSVEYIGVGAALVVLIAVLASTSMGTFVSQSFGYVFCQAAAVVDGRSCTAPTFDASSAAEGDPDELTPEEQAYAGDYVALGDSYSSGEGADDYIDGTDDDRAYSRWADDTFGGWKWAISPLGALALGDPNGNHNLCRRSENAYSAIVYDQGDFAGDYVFGACSGAVSSDYSSPNHGGNENEGPQRDHITDDTSLITLSMGGNDFGFGDTISDCVVHGSTAGLAGGCTSDEATQAAYDRVEAKIPELVAMYNQMIEDAPEDARIIVVGYPQMFPNPPTGPTWGMSINAQRWINDELLGYANDAIRRAIAQSDGSGRIEFVDVTDALAGHEAGTADPWLHDIVLGFDNGNLIPASANSYHPTDKGQAAIAAIVQDAVVNGGEKP